jgi:hypothetical protein
MVGGGGEFKYVACLISDYVSDIEIVTTMQ